MRRVPVAAVAVTAVLAMTAVACSGGGTKKRAAPRTTAAPTSVVATSTSLEIVPGNPRTVTTLSTALGPGTARLGGVVTGPEGPVAGAVVRVERLVGDAVAAGTVASGPNGQWSIGGVSGGRYRVRAWRPPDLDQLQAVLLFLRAGEARDVPLMVARFGNGGAVATVSPPAPVAGQPASLVVTVSNGTVDGEGILHAGALATTPVQVVLSGALVVDPPDAALTDGAGNATFQVHCVAAGAAGGQVVVAGVPRPLELPACGPPR